jgi:hypothetical protein
MWGANIILTSIFKTFLKKFILFFLYFWTIKNNSTNGNIKSYVQRKQRTLYQRIHWLLKYHLWALIPPTHRCYWNCRSRKVV